MKESIVISELFTVLPSVCDFHARTTPLYQYLYKIVGSQIKDLFSSEDPQEVDMGCFGPLKFPFVSMGSVTSLNLFELDELIIFSFYHKNRGRYKAALDIGANLGLHSIIMSRCGFDVACYEPDPTHFALLERNLAINSASRVTPFNMAVSNQSGSAEFVRVCGNTTGSHLAGAKLNPYGKLDRFEVCLAEFTSLIRNVDLVKMDVEGHEKIILLATTRDDWKNADLFVEIENADNRQAVFNHFADIGLNMFSQKANWRKAANVADLPKSYREGMLFASTKDSMPW
jgi:FkbM family methyltransferase